MGPFLAPRASPERLLGTGSRAAGFQGLSELWGGRVAGQPSTRHRTGLPGGGCSPRAGSIHAELSRNAFVHFKGTETNVPLQNGRAAAGAATSHSPKPLGLRFGKKQKISQICHLGKQLVTTTGPALLKNQDVGSVSSGSGAQWPVPGPWAQARGTCSPRSAHVHANSVQARGQAHASALLLTRGRTSSAGTPASAGTRLLQRG